MTIVPALEGIVVVEVTSEVRGRYCGRLFAELGATVVRVELPADAEDTDRPWLDPGKESVVLDWRADGGSILLDQICEKVDVLIEDLSASESRDRFNASFLERHRQLVHVSMTPFGLGGAWADRKAADLNISALSGMAMINRVEEGPPMREPGPQTEIVAALGGFTGALVALEERERSGRGQLVDVSSLESMVNMLSPQVLQQAYQPGLGGQRDADFLFPCADGWMSLIILADPAWESAVSVLELPVKPDDERFATQGGRRAHLAEIRELLIPRLASYTRRELFEMLSAMRIVCGMVMKPEDLTEDAHLEARKAFVQIDGTALRIPRVPIRTKGVSLPERLTLASKGSHTDSWVGERMPN